MSKKIISCEARVVGNRLVTVPKYEEDKGENKMGNEIVIDALKTKIENIDKDIKDHEQRISELKEQREEVSKELNKVIQGE